MLHKLHILHWNYHYFCYIFFYINNNNNTNSLCLLLAEESRISFNLLQDVWVKTLLFCCIYVTRTMICIKYLKPLMAAAYQVITKENSPQLWSGQQGDIDRLWRLMGHLRSRSQVSEESPGPSRHISQRPFSHNTASLVQYELAPPIITHPTNDCPQHASANKA